MTARMTACWVGAVLCAWLAYGDQGGRTVIANQHFSIAFDASTGGFAAITSLEGVYEFIRKTAEHPLSWRLVLHNEKGKELAVDNTQAAAPKIEQNAEQISLHWGDIVVEQDKGALDVRLTCKLPSDSDTALLSLSVDNRSKAFALWQVQFPVIAPLSESGAADVCVGRGNWGERYEKASKRITGEYPSNNLPMQLMLLQEQEHGLYLAAYDRGAMYKRFEIQPGAEFVVNARASDMGVPGNKWAAPFSFALGVYHGDWMTGCKRYRAWALKEAPWTSKGPLANRKDVADGIKNVCAWLQTGGAPEEVVPAVKKFSDAIHAPVGVHWYNWHQIPFDTYYPNYFPPKPGFAEGVAELKKAGVVVMPYINARLWDTANENFAQAKPAATIDEEGKVTIEEYGSGAKLAVMCPTQKLWQEKVFENIRRLVEECGVNAVYMDQIGSAPPRMCFNKNHGHPLGSGDWWVSGYRELLTPIKNWCTSDGRQVGLTTENDAEPYMDNVDGNLIWVPRDDHEIPMTTAVYSGYTLYFASNHAFSFGDESYCLCQARDFTWGSQLGWDGVDILKPEHAAKLEFLSRLARLRAKTREFLVYGELLEVLQPQNDAPGIPDIEGKWNTPSGDAPVKLKAVQAALWRNPEGALGVIAANADTKAHSFTFALDPARYGISESQRWSITTLEPEGDEKTAPPKTGKIPSDVNVSGRSAVILIAKPIS